MRDLYMEIHEELIDDYLTERPNASRDEAIDATADNAWNVMRDRMADGARIPYC